MRVKCPDCDHRVDLHYIRKNFRYCNGESQPCPCCKIWFKDETEQQDL